jgi:hypothetical protein
MNTAAARRLDPANETIPDKERYDRVARFRPRELDKLMDVRGWRKGVPNDDNGTRFALRTLDTFALSGDVARQRATYFLQRYCAWMTLAARADAIQTAFAARRLWSAEELGNDLEVTEAERKKAGIKTFRAAGMTDVDMKEKQKAENAERARRNRRKNRLHPKTKASKPALRAAIIVDVLADADGWVDVSAICAELSFMKTIHFAGLKGKDLTAAVHRAIQYGIKDRTIEKRIEPGPKTPVAQIRKRRGT